MNGSLPRLLLSPPDTSEKERELLLEAFDSNWIAPTGPALERFERDFADFIGAPAAVALSSGTAALHLALLLAGVRSGADVLVPTLTFAASANVVTYCGASPVFIDAEPTSWCIDPELVEAELAARDRAGRRVAAVMAVDLYGQCADYRALEAVCERYGVPLVEDAAEAAGAAREGRMAGRFGAAAAFSFNGNKIMTTGGGGMLVADDAALVERARFLSTQAREPVLHYEHREIGFNYRMSNLLAAIGCAQLERLPGLIARRGAIGARYRALLADVDGIEFMPQPIGSTPNHWLTVITIDARRFGAGSRQVIAALDAANIESRPAWKPMHLQPVFGRMAARGGAVAERIFREGVCLPSGSALSDDDVARVADVVRSCARAPRRAGRRLAETAPR